LVERAVLALVPCRVVYPIESRSLVNAASPGRQQIGRAQIIRVIPFALGLAYTPVISERIGGTPTRATRRRTMPNLLKIGAKVINLDLVTDMVVTTEEIIVYLSAPAERCDQSQSRMLRFQSAEADRLRAWLNTHATELGSALEAESYASAVIVQKAPARRSAGVGRLVGGMGRALHRSLFDRSVS
jgi:hypothetical protein